MSDGLPRHGEADWTRLPPGSRPPEPPDPDAIAFLDACAGDPDLLAHALVDAQRNPQGEVQIGWRGPYGLIPGGMDNEPAPHWQPIYREKRDV